MLMTDLAGSSEIRLVERASIKMIEVNSANDEN
jgi:hypothetical protein